MIMANRIRELCEFIQKKAAIVATQFNNTVISRTVS